GEVGVGGPPPQREGLLDDRGPPRRPSRRGSEQCTEEGRIDRHPVQAVPGGAVQHRRSEGTAELGDAGLEGARRIAGWPVAPEVVDELVRRHRAAVTGHQGRQQHTYLAIGNPQRHARRRPHLQRSQDSDARHVMVNPWRAGRISEGPRPRLRAMSEVTVIGLGPMGSAMAATFLEAGHDVTVWNRTASKAGPLVAKGAKQAERPATGELLVISQISYQAMYDSLGEARLDGKTLVNLSSGTPAELREAARWVAERGGTLITGGIMVPPPGIGQPGAYTFYSGPKEALDRYAATLEALSAVTYVGEDPGLAMMYYQAQLLMFWSALTSFM